MTEPPPPSTVTLAVGMPVTLKAGEQMYVHSWKGAWVFLMDAAGKPQPPLLRGVVARAIMSPDNIPPQNLMLNGLRERLSAIAVAKLEEDEGIARMVEMGLRADQADDEIPPDGLNPALVPDERIRISNVAEILAIKWGIKYASARRRITRALEKRSGDLGAMVDDRYTKPRTDRQHELMEAWVQEYLIAREFDSTLHTSTKYLAFRVWLNANHPGIDAPPERTYNRMAHNTYEKMPHLKQKAKTRVSAARAPKVSDAPRFLEEPGGLWLIDTTTSNVEVRDPAFRRGKSREFRCEFTKIIDANTRLIVGRSIAESGTGFGAVLAIADAFASMVDEREEVIVEGRRYPRPFVGIPRAMARYPIMPRRLLADNGRPFLSHEYVWQMERLGIEFEPARVKNPQAKARIERSFGTNTTQFEEPQPGFLSYSVEGRGEQPAGRHLLTWQELFRRDEQFTDLHNFSEHRGIEGETGRRISPYQRWVEGVDRMGTMEIPLWTNEWLRFLPSFTAKFNRYGVTRKGQVFNAPILETLLRTPKVAIDGRYRFSFNPSDLRQIYCFDPDGMAFEIPWVMRTEDTPQFGDFTRGFIEQDYQGLTYNRLTFQDFMVMYLVEWAEIDAAAQKVEPLLSRNEEMNSAALSRLRSVDHGSIISEGAPSFGGQPGQWEDDDEEDDFYYRGDDDPFASFG